MDLNEIVEKYIALREKKAEMKKEYDTKVADVDMLIDRLDGVILKTFRESGVDSVKTKAGTAYTSVRSSAKVADPEMFRNFVIEGSHWEFYENRVSKEVVAQYKTEHNDLPPGISWSEVVTVGVRKS